MKRKTQQQVTKQQQTKVKQKSEVQRHKECKYYRYSSPVTGLEWPRGFQEVKVPRFRDNGTGWW